MSVLLIANTLCQAAGAESRASDIEDGRSERRGVGEQRLKRRIISTQEPKEPSQ
jgi:hypothetical protein